MTTRRPRPPADGLPPPAVPAILGGMADTVSPEPPYALGWASAMMAALALLSFPTSDEMGFRYEDRAILSTFIGAAAATGSGLGIGALRRGIRPVAVAWVGLLGNAGVVALAAARLISWLATN